MSDLIPKINNSKARAILQEWLAKHQTATGEQLQHVANHLKNGYPLKAGQARKA